MSARLVDLDVLRGLAVLGILFHHLTGNAFPWPVPALDAIGGWIQTWPAMDLFLVVSGFVIARHLIPRLEDRDRALVAVRSFWIRRAYRLLPSAWAWLALTVALAAVANRSGAFGTVRTNVEGAVASVLLVANFRFADAFGRHSMGATFHHWSLSLEEQFYLVLPVLILLAGRRLALVMGLLAATQLFSTRSVLMLMTRTDGLALGVLLAVAAGHPGYRLFEPTFLARARNRLLLVPGLILATCLTAGSTAPPIVGFPFGIAVLAAFALTFAASFDRGYLVGQGGAQRLLAAIGRRSYSLYLAHIPIYYLGRELGFRLDHGPYTPARAALLLAGTGILLALATEASYRWIETPWREHGRKVSDRLMAEAPAPASPGTAGQVPVAGAGSPPGPATGEGPCEPADVGLFDAVQEGWFAGARGEVFPGFPVSAEDVVLDVGSGEGGAAGFCASLGAHVIVTDVDATKVHAQRRKLEGSRARKVECFVSDGNPLPLPDATATRVVCMEVLEHVDDPARLMAEMVRAGRPGSLYLLTVPAAVSEVLVKPFAPPMFAKPNHVRILDRAGFESLVRGAGLEVLTHSEGGFFWAIWWLLFWAAPEGGIPGARAPTDAWTRLWHSVVKSANGPALKRGLDRILPKSQVIVARKPA